MFNLPDFMDNDQYGPINQYQNPFQSVGAAIPQILGRLLNRNNPQEQEPMQQTFKNPTQHNYFNTIQKAYNPPQPPSPYGNFGQGSDAMSMLRQRESGGNYRAQNNLGYSGAYQFGAKALEDTGLLKPGASRQGNKALNNPDNWNIPGGKEAFLSNPKLQDNAMEKFMALNERKLRKMGHINKNTSPREKRALLMAAHLGGPGGVAAMLKGKNRKDAFGTSVADYFNLGLRGK